MRTDQSRATIILADGRAIRSPWQTRRGLPWRLRFEFAGITRPRKYACWRSGLRMPLRPGACWRWRRSMAAGLAPGPPGSAAVGCERGGDGVWVFKPRGDPALGMDKDR